MTTTATYAVLGMTCEHCVRSVRGAVAGLPGVTEVDVDLRSGQVTVRSEAELHPADIEAAVADAGYEVS